MELAMASDSVWALDLEPETVPVSEQGLVQE
jgi:hypothetical protein